MISKRLSPAPPFFATLLAGVLGISAPVVDAGVEISEFMASNKTTLATAQGLYEDWVEIRNGTGAAVDLAGWYLTDDPADPRKWRFPSTAATSPLPAGGYLVAFADGATDAVIAGQLHANFKLSADGEYLALIEPDGETVAYQYAPVFPPQTTDRSYGIDAGTGTHAYFTTPTPGSANAQATAGAVQFSATSATFTTAFSLTLSPASPGPISIRYTLDGSVPTSSSTLYAAPIPISATTRVRARAIASGLTDGPVRSETFFHLASDAADFVSEIPVVVIDNFGAGEIPLPDSLTRQPAQMMLFEPVNGECRLTTSPTVASRAGLRRRGESTLRSTASKPNISLETWGEVNEEGRAISPLGMPADSDWVLYAPWTIDTAMIRNPFIYEVSNQAGRYAVRTRFVEVFLNHGGGSLTESGDYYGLYILMERIKQGGDRVDVAELPAGAVSEPDISGGYIWKKDKVESLADIDNFAAAGIPLPTTLNDRPLQYVYPGGDTMTAGQKTWLTNHLNAIHALIPNGNYESMIDVGAFVDHHILNVFANNADGLSASTYYHKDRNGLVQMGPIWDFDRSMACDNDTRASNPEVWSLASNTSYFFNSGGHLWFTPLAQNDPDFWMVWVDRWQAMRKGPLGDAAMSERIERYRLEIANAAARNYAKWPNSLNSGTPLVNTDWSGKVDVMKNHVLVRARWIDDQLIDPPAFSHAGGRVASGFQLSMTGPETKFFTLNGSDPRAPGGAAAGTAYATPITITGNTLVRSRAGNGATFVNAPSTWPWSAITEAMFVVEPAPLAITEIMYHPRPPQGAAEAAFSASDFEFIEIQNTGTTSCSLIGVELLDGVVFDFTRGNSTLLAAGGRGVLVANLEAFKARYPNWATLNILGVFDGSLSDGGEPLLLAYDTLERIALADFDYEDDWHPCTDGEGYSLVLNDPQSAPASWDTKWAWSYSPMPDGSPGAADPAPAYPPGALVINEVLCHQDADNPGDWIELHNTTGAGINIGGWFLSDSGASLRKYTIPPGTLVPAGGFIVFNEHDHFGSAFALSEHGDSVFLSSGSGGVLSNPAYREFQVFGGQERDATFGRHLRSDGTSAFSSQASATPGGANAGPRVGPLVIREIMYHPPTGGHEYIEIHNISNQAVDLYDPANPANVWSVSGIDFEFPTGTSLGACQTLLLVRNTITPSAFRAINQVPSTVAIFSYNGELDDNSETLTLNKPGTPNAATGYVPSIIVEEVEYRDTAPWPTAADGTGMVLARINTGTFADDPANWQAAAGHAPVLFPLAVLSGTGDGAYTAGTAVTVQADAPASNQAFVKWIGNVAAITDVGNPSISFVMPPHAATITALYSAETTFIANNAMWKYHDQGQDLGTAWRSSAFNDQAWPAGAAELGYGEGDESTVIGFGGNTANRHITSYFRHRFSVNAGSGLGNLSLELLRDDGAVVYLNGQEVLRDNMPTGTVGYQTVASSAVGGAAEDTFYPFSLPPSALVDGVNVIAVEIHQRAANSSDLSFALRLKGYQTVNEAVLDGDADGMFDAWEVTHFGSTEAALPGADGDGDGVPNSAEFVSGTLPGDARSFFKIEQIEKLAAGGYRLTWTVVPGRKYSVEWTQDPRTPFFPIAPNAVGGTFTDTLYTSGTAGFYRVRVELE